MIRKYYFILSIVLILLFSISVIGQTIKFHPIGDSTTEAYELETSWRYWFNKLLSENGFDNVDFVGSRKGTNMGTNFSDNNWDMDHDGHTSSTASQVLNGGLAHGHSGNIKIWAPQYTPHIAVIYLGTNDIRQGRSSSDIIKTFEDIIQVLRNARAEVKIVVCQIPYWNYGAYGGNKAGVDGLNALIPSLENLGTASSPIKIVDLNTDYNLNDHRDGIHPGTTGAPKVANRIFAAVEPWLKENANLSIKITSPSSNELFEKEEPITITTEVIAKESSITKVEFFSGTTKIGEDATAPYTVNWSSTNSGTFSLSAKVSNTAGESATSQVSIEVTIPQSPYNGTAHSIPGIIQFEEFDLGGNGSAYKDDSPGSETGISFRNDEEVDIEECTDVDGGYNIGWATAGEWLEYTVNVGTAGIYSLELRVACDGDGRTVDLQIGDVLLDDIALPNTGGWQNWETFTIPNVALDAEKQIMKLTVGDVSYVNLNHVKIEGLVTSTNKSTPTITLHPNPTNGIIYLSESVDWILFNTTGTQLSRGHHTEIDLSNYSQGIYLLLVGDKSHLISKK